MRKKYLTKATKEQRVYFGSLFKSSRWRESQQQDWRGLVTPAIRKGRETNTSAPLSLSLLLRAGPNPGDFTTHIHSRPSLQFKSFWKPALRPFRRCVSMVILNPAKLTATIKCPTDERVFSVGEQCGCAVWRLFPPSLCHCQRSRAVPFPNRTHLQRQLKGSLAHQHWVV